MALESFIPTVWAGELLLNLEKSLVYGNVSNNNYEGEINAYGDEVVINEIGDITINDYNPNSTSITPQTLDDGEKKLKIDQRKYFAFKVDDVDRAQSKPEVMNAAMRRAGYNLRDTADIHIAGKYAEAGSTRGTDGTPKTVNSANVVEELAEVGQLLTQKNVPMEGRWIIIPPWFHTKLTLAKIDLVTDNAEVFNNGFVGRAIGFDIYVSNNVQYGSSGSATTKSKIMAGYPETMSFAGQILKMEAYRPESSFSDAIKGLYVYGFKVVRPDALAVLTASYAAEA